MPTQCCSKAPQDQATAPGPWQEVTQAVDDKSTDYSSKSLFGSNAPYIEIDAHSSGNDAIPPLNELGVPIVGGASDNWLAYVVSVKENTVGLPGGHIGALSGTQPVGAELIGYYSQGSENIDSSLPGSFSIEATASSLGFGGTFGETPDVDALDYGVGVHAFSGGNSRSSVIFPVKNAYYFSITPQSVDAWNDAHPGSSQFALDASTWVGPHAGAIYRVLRNGSTWSDIELFRSPDELDLPESIDIDALAVRHSGASIVVFSTAYDPLYPQRDQLLIHESTTVAHTALLDRDPVTGGTTTVTSRLGLLDELDDVDGLCAIDPEGATDLDPAVGTPVTSAAKMDFLPPGAPVMGLSLQRAELVAGSPEEIVLQLSGWGFVHPQNSQVTVFMSAGAEPVPPNVDPLSPYLSNGVWVLPRWIKRPAVVRTASDHQFELTIPGHAVPNGSYFSAFAVLSQPASLGGNVIGGSLVMQIAQ